MKKIEGQIEKDYAWIRFKKYGCKHKIKVNFYGDSEYNYLFRVRISKFNQKGTLTDSENRIEEYADYDIKAVLKSEARHLLNKQELKQLDTLS